MTRLRAATRGSTLARWQTDRVIALLGGDVEIVVVQTTGDARADVPIREIGGQGIFVKEVQHAVLEGRADIAVHSAKDLPSTSAEGLVLACVPERADPSDALVGSTLEAIPVGGRVATGSVRRQAQLACARPDLTFADLRGSIDTRLDKASGHDAIVVAYAALERLGYQDRAAEILSTSVMLPQVAQGALAVECRADDDPSRAALQAIDDPVAHRCVRAERAFLAELGGSCDLPVGALATVDGDGLRLDGLLARADGHVLLRHGDAGTDPDQLGRAVAHHLLAAGGRVLLAELRGET